MLFFLILVTTEILTPALLRQHFHSGSRVKYYISLILHIIISIWLWILYLEIEAYKGFFDTARHIWLLLNMTGMIIAVVVPRIILVILHFTGKAIRMKNGGHIRWLTNSGLVFMIFMLTIVGTGTFFGKNNFSPEKVTIKIRDLSKNLDGFTIVQLSDLHLSGFYHHSHLLQKVIEDINALKPDLIVNTGDFVTYGWREYERNDTILKKAKGTYGNYAILGNHDYGTYHPDFTEADKENNVLLINKLIKSSGYNVLNDESCIISVGNSKIALIGVITKGRHPDMIYGDLDKAISGIDSVDLKILLSHDPNHWELKVNKKTDIDLTLSGHTHGMQLGIITEKFKWSPSKYFFPHWNGLYSEGEQFHYVNRGLGVLAIPFRIWMPPEITIITLRPED